MIKNMNDLLKSGLMITNDDVCQEDGVYIPESDIELTPSNKKSIKEGENFESDERYILVEKY